MEFERVVRPDTVACLAAYDVALEFASPALLAHSVRAWYWAVGLAEQDGVRFDAELVYVAAVLHDIGLTPAFDNVGLPFEEAGGLVASVLGAGAGWDSHRRRRVGEAIERHMWPSVDARFDPEGHLLEIATSLDIRGVRADDLPADYVAAVLRAHPRGALAEEFDACITDQAHRKPQSQARRLLDGGLRGALRDNPLERLGPSH